MEDIDRSFKLIFADPSELPYLYEKISNGFSVFYFIVPHLTRRCYLNVSKSRVLMCSLTLRTLSRLGTRKGMVMQNFINKAAAFSSFD